GRAGAVRAEDPHRRIRIERVVMDPGPGDRPARDGVRDPAADEDAGHQVDVALDRAEPGRVGNQDTGAEIRLADRRGAHPITLRVLAVAEKLIAPLFVSADQLAGAGMNVNAGERLAGLLVADHAADQPRGKGHMIKGGAVDLVDHRALETSLPL